MADDLLTEAILESTWDLDQRSVREILDAIHAEDHRAVEAVGEVLPDVERAVEAMAGHGVDAALVARMKPWAVAVTLMTARTRSGAVLDRVLYQRALTDAKPVDGLETVAEQVALFDGLPLQEQVELLRDSLDHLPDIDRMLVDLRQAWLRRDLARLVEINQATLRVSDPQFAAAFNQREKILEL